MWCVCVCVCVFVCMYVDVCIVHISVSECVGLHTCSVCFCQLGSQKLVSVF